MASQAEHAAPARRGLGWVIIARKEMADHLLSARFLILVLLVGIAASGTVYAAAGAIREVAPDATGTPALFLRLFTVAPERVPPFFSLLGIMAPLLGIAFGFDAVNGERGRGTLPRLLSQPVYRDDVINGKFAAGLAVIGVILCSLTLLVAGIGLVRLGIVPSVTDVIRLAAFLVLTVVYVGFWLAFAMLCSVALRRPATSALVALAVWLVLTLFGALLVGLVADVVTPVTADSTEEVFIRNAEMQQQLARVSPGTLYEEATAVLLNPSVRTIGFALPVQLDRAIPSVLSLDQSLLLAWPQTVALIALTVLSFAVAYVLFLRQEVRA